MMSGSTLDTLRDTATELGRTRAERDDLDAAVRRALLDLDVILDGRLDGVRWETALRDMRADLRRAIGQEVAR